MSRSGFQFGANRLEDFNKVVIKFLGSAVFWEADENFRETRQKLRDEAGKYLELIEQSLQGKQHTEHLFAIRWRITA
jgi:hypothetical protein